MPTRPTRRRASCSSATRTACRSSRWSTRRASWSGPRSRPGPGAPRQPDVRRRRASAGAVLRGRAAQGLRARRDGDDRRRLSCDRGDRRLAERRVRRDGARGRGASSATARSSRRAPKAPSATRCTRALSPSNTRSGKAINMAATLEIDAVIDPGRDPAAGSPRRWRRPGHDRRPAVSSILLVSGGRRAPAAMPRASDAVTAGSSIAAPIGAAAGASSRDGPSSLRHACACTIAGSLRHRRAHATFTQSQVGRLRVARPGPGSTGDRLRRYLTGGARRMAKSSRDQGRRRRLDLRALARQLLPGRAAAAPRARLRGAAPDGDRDQRHLLPDPEPESFAKWRDETPDDFVFSVKASRYATNRRVLAEAGDSIERFIAAASPSWAEARSDRLAVHADQAVRPGRLRAFLRLLPKRWAASRCAMRWTCDTPASCRLSSSRSPASTVSRPSSPTPTSTRRSPT